MTTPTFTTSPLERLPAVRRARAELLLSEIRGFRDNRIEYHLLADVLLDPGPDADAYPWTARLLEQGLDDLAAAGLISVAAGTGNDITITRITEARAA